MSVSDDLERIAMFIENMKHDDMELRVDAMKHLLEIAQALGPQRTRAELIPFLNESTEDEDEVLVIVAEQIGHLVPAVGGGSYCFCLFDPLETLASAEELAVREKAVASIQEIIQQLDDNDLLQYFVPLVERMASKDWFTSRMSACFLLAPGYQRLPSNQQQSFRYHFSLLCKDDTPMVRRAAAANLGHFAKKLELVHIEIEILPLFLSLSHDDQDSVRISAIDNCIVLSSLFPLHQTQQHILPEIGTLVKDKAWRVRWSVASRFHEFCQTINDRGIMNLNLYDSFEKLLKDSEPEVRSAASFKVVEVSKNLDIVVLIQKMMPCVRERVFDNSELVRAAIATVICNFAQLLGKDQTVVVLLPLLLDLLRDRSSEVRLNIISSLHVLNDVIGVEVLSSSLLPALNEIATDSNWRIREAIISHIPQLAKNLGPQFFSGGLTEMCMNWLNDEVFSIRKAASNILNKLALLFGPIWVKEQVFPILTKMLSSNFSQKMTASFTVQALSEVVDQNLLENEILGFTFDLLKDSIPNVRFNAVKAMEIIAQRVEPRIVETRISPQLRVMLNDPDRDVRFYTRKALQVIVP